MKLVLNNIARVALLALIGMLAACSSVKDLTNVNIWPFGSSADAPRVYLPANSTPYLCEGNKKFFVRMLDKGASAWLILPDREVLLVVVLAQGGASKVYSNGISKLDLTNDDVTLDVNETTKYLGCKANAIAKVAGAAKPELAVQPTAVTTSEKGWLSKLKFWEGDEQPKPVEPSPKAVAVVSTKAAESAVVVDMPAKQNVAPVVAEEPPAPAPNKLSAPVEAPAEVDLPAKVKEVAQQENQAEQAVVPAEEKATTYEAGLAQSLDAWANAWRTKNADVYLSAYSAKFKPEGMSHKAWMAQRKQRVGANPAEITLVLDKVNVVADAKKAEVTFIQHYTTGKFSDSVAKVLNFENENGRWLIIKESAQSKK
jgi:hypothetical protein